MRPRRFQDFAAECDDGWTFSQEADFFVRSRRRHSETSLIRSHLLTAVDGEVYLYRQTKVNEGVSLERPSQ
jgi:hypothetical protein